ncbi:S24 family peptidase [Umezawaea sp. Da 62-37]|uniref:S24 family peptidase n=1 Tax=Umezawaea sp. Da 62-37 TaxID=3075927 RepID=UPI0028F7173E|nr:S24 family peptidase [Umezawaea sp. Da 62-37]WNV90553.1 S24 family peptidase [Umezawaea sp. Da 62-37]
MAPQGGNPLPLLRVRGPSMVPAVRDGDVVVVRYGAVPETGDLVLVRWAARPGQLSIKRAREQRGSGLWQVLGDNQFGSTDSRTLGPAEVLGVVRWRLWPRPRRLR